MKKNVVYTVCVLVMVALAMPCAAAEKKPKAKRRQAAVVIGQSSAAEKSPKARRRQAAADAVVDQSAPLKDRLIAPNKGMREAAIEELSKLDGGAKKEIVSALTRVLKIKSKSAQAQWPHAVEVLSKMNAITPEVVDVLISHFYGKGLDMLPAVTVFERMVSLDHRIITALCWGGLTPEKPDLYRRIIRLLEKIDMTDKEVILPLINEMKKGTRGVRKTLYILGHIDQDKVRKALPVVVATEEKRNKITMTLKALGPARPEDIPAIVDLLKNPLWDVRKNAVEVLRRTVDGGNNVSPKLVAGLGQALRDEGFRIRIDAAIALGSIGSAAKDTVPALTNALQDKLLSVRYHAADALGKIGPGAERAVPALIASLKDESPFVREIAAEALEKIGTSGAKEGLVVFRKEHPQSDEQGPTKGYNCLFMGHSLFVPSVWKIDGHPQWAGFPLHKQTVVFEGGYKGAPERLWNSPTFAVKEAKELLATGTVDLLALTYFRKYDDVEYYCKWIDLALKYNPDTRFIIHCPWGQWLEKSFEDFWVISKETADNVYIIIDQLHKIYPEQSFPCVPQGDSMIALWELRNKGGLPEMPNLRKGAHGDPTACLFADTVHGGETAGQLGMLLWLALIYEIDIEEYDGPLEIKTKADLRKLAKEILLNNPYSGFSGSPK